MRSVIGIILHNCWGIIQIVQIDMLVIFLVMGWSPEGLLTCSLFHITLLFGLYLLYIFLCWQSYFFDLFIMLDNKASNLITVDIRIVAVCALLLIRNCSRIIDVLWLLRYFHNHRISGWVPAYVAHLFCLQSELLSHVRRWKKSWLRVWRNCHAIKTVVGWRGRVILGRLITLLWALTSLWSIEFHRNFIVIFLRITRLSLYVFLNNAILIVLCVSLQLFLHWCHARLDFLLKNLLPLETIDNLWYFRITLVGSIQ